ncbi:hypothetical protein HPB52_018843 [Rhipicephalus sanguineus]|uniref:Endonuclease/exonuclease/phosphatase domain-containing protein n=1 Tax=Rhipicephalus sanguineus TaxID=34632 RepID=A0A9D4Q7S8_RHISA|nr:hypothetical protein HPB52_018843 [Rhipicephalus sanguineus]
MKAGKLDSSSSRMQTARRAKHAEDNGTPSERRVAAEYAGLRPLMEVTRKTGPPLNDQMDTEDTSDDGVGARDARDDEGNAEWSLFTKRKPIRKVKPEQLRLERTIDYIMDHLRCETATILDARRLGKTNMLLLTFNTPSPPTRLVFDYEITRVYDKKVTANSKTPPYTGAAPSQQSKTPSASQPVTAQDSAYAQMLSILRQERPLTSKDRNDSFEWLREVEAQAGSLPILVGGDFNAKHPTWGYTKADPRGCVFYDVIEMSTLNICNSLDTPTRIGLHAKQQDTTPDLTLASAGLVRQWEVKSTTWGSDHLPIIITLNRKKVIEKREVLVFDWEKFRMATGDCFTDFEGFSAAVAQARPYAREYIPCNDTATHMDMHLANLWRKANRLTQQYRYKGKRHRDLMRLKRQYRLIKEYQEMLETDAWHDTCAKFGREPGLKRLWQILRSLLGKKKGAPPLSELFLREEPTSLEDRVIHTFFPYAAETPPLQLPYIRIDDPRAELDTPFTLGELVAALAQSKKKSAPGHDGVTWQELRNLSDEH